MSKKELIKKKNNIAEQLILLQEFHSANIAFCEANSLMKQMLGVDLYDCVDECDDPEYNTTKEILLKFMRWIEKRGFIKDDLCYDTEHQVETFIDQILPQYE